MSFDKCSICKSENFVDFTVCQCGKMFLCDTCSIFYGESCMDNNVVMSCFYCSTEMLEPNMTEKCKTDYFNLLTKKAKSDTAIYYTTGNSKRSKLCLKEMECNFDKLIRKTIPKGILIAIKILNGKKFKKLSQEKNEKYEARIKKLCKKSSSRCSCEFCSDDNQLNGKTCPKCSIDYCKTCGYECYPGHKKVCKPTRNNKIPVGNVICNECENVQEKFYSFPKTKCGKCSNSIVCSEVEEYNAYSDIDSENICNLLTQYKESINYESYPGSKFIFPTFFEYSMFKMEINKAKKYALLNLSLKIKIDLEQTISSKFIKNALKDTIYPNIEAIIHNFEQIEITKLEKMEEYLKQNEKFLKKKQKKEERLRLEREQEEIDKADEEERKRLKKEARSKKIKIKEEFMSSDEN